MFPRSASNPSSRGAAAPSQTRYASSPEKADDNADEEEEVEDVRTSLYNDDDDTRPEWQKRLEQRNFAMQGDFHADPSDQTDEPAPDALDLLSAIYTNQDEKAKEEAKKPIAPVVRAGSVRTSISEPTKPISNIAPKTSKSSFVLPSRVLDPDEFDEGEKGMVSHDVAP